MSILQINTSPYPDTTQDVELDGVVYNLRIRWSERGEAWHVDIRDTEGDAILMGLKLVTLYPLLKNYRHLAVPPGELMFVDSKDLSGRPTLEEMGDRYKLLYIDTGGFP